MTNFKANDEFKTTHWSLVVSSREKDSDVRRTSLGELSEAYWYPLFAYLRRKGHGPEESADFVQSFFVELIDKDFLDAVSPEKGRFRWFLMSAVKRFVAKEQEKQAARKRGGGRKLLIPERRRCRTAISNGTGRWLDCRKVVRSTLGAGGAAAGFGSAAESRTKKRESWNSIWLSNPH